MKKLLIILLFQVGICNKGFCQEIITVSLEDSLTIFSVQTVNREYGPKDTLKIELKITNKFNDKIMILDIDKNRPDLLVSEDRNEITYNLGGYFDPQFERWFKLKIIEAKSYETYTFKIPISEETDLLNRGKTYKFYTYTGYFKFDPDLEYLTKIEEETVAFKSTNDIIKATSLHKSIFLGYLPIRIEKE